MMISRTKPLLVCFLLLVSGISGPTAAQETGDSKARPLPSVILFSQPFCPGCEAAKSYFQSQQIDFKEFDISASPNARSTFEKLGGRGTPLLLIHGKRVHGFSPPVIEHVLSGEAN